jgi:hypothetical protein
MIRTYGNALRRHVAHNVGYGRGVPDGSGGEPALIACEPSEKLPKKISVVWRPVAFLLDRIFVCEFQMFASFVKRPSIVAPDFVCAF